MPRILGILVLVTLFCHCYTTAHNNNHNHHQDSPATLSAKAWFTSKYHPSEGSYPEQSDPVLQTKKNVGLAFSGGGTRSYLSSLGYLRGLHDLDLLKNVRYISGVSGGAWATVVYSYYQKQQSTPERPVAQSDEELLGDIMEPEQCTFNNLNKLNATCGRYSATASFNIDLVELFIKYKEVPLAWFHQVNNQFLIRYGVSLDSSFTWNQTTLDDILSRNPTLTADQFVLPHNTERPYPIFVATHEGPLEGAPFPEKKRAFAGFDFTPLYSGHREIINKSWEKFGGGPPASRLIGGLLETFAFGRDQPPVEGLHEPSGLLEIPMNPDKQLFTLNTAVATSSYFLGGAVTTLGPLPFRRTDKLGIIIPTFPVATLEDDAPPMSTKMVFGDGGTVVQPGLMGMIKRKVAHIIMFLNFEIPLTGSDAWNPLEHPPTGSNNEIDDDMPSFFGLRNNDTVQLGYDLHRNQVFAASEFAPVAAALQKNQKLGNGAVATSTHTTIENKYWNVKAGTTVNVTWVYLSRAFNWEAKLPPDVKAMFSSEQDPTVLPNVTYLSKVGELEYANFPNFNTFLQLRFFNGSANLLSNLAGWVIKANNDVFQQALGN
jgi:hypothetical protein